MKIKFKIFSTKRDSSWLPAESAPAAIACVVGVHMARANDRRSVKDSFPVEIKRPTKAFLDAVNQVAEPIKQLEECQQNVKNLEPLDSARVDLTTAYAINSLFWSK